MHNVEQLKQFRLTTTTTRVGEQRLQGGTTTAIAICQRNGEKCLIVLQLQK